MENRKIIMKCCICGRVKTENGWEYQFQEEGDENLASHGFCTVCYGLEIKKIRMGCSAVVPALAEVGMQAGQTALPAMAVYQ